MGQQLVGRQTLFAKIVATIFHVVVLISTTAQASDPDLKTNLSNLKSWGYQLQGLDVQQAARMPHDLLVVDYSKDGTEAGALTWSELSQLKQKPDGTRRIVLAYMSIGEAEKYRYYWNPSWRKMPPRWLGQENKQWLGNFLVRHWMPEWQQIILQEETGYLSKIISSGFDGVYLDRIDAYSHWSNAHKDSRAQMIEFVIKLSRLAKQRKDGFLVIAQNAEELLVDPRYTAHIEGIAKEDMLFGVSHRSKPNSKSLRTSHIKYLNIAKSNNKLVLVVEYISRRSEKFQKIAREIRKLHFIPYISERKLDTLFPPPNK